MQFHEALSRFPYLLLRLTLKPQETLKLPAQNKGNTLRGAFGSSFRRLVCVPECRNAHACPLAESCPYKLIFEPSPPQGSDRLSKNQDIPRPFIFRPPLDLKTSYEAGETFEFDLVLLGTAANYLPYFVLAFREVVSAGFGLNRARCELTEVRAIQINSQVPDGSLEAIGHGGQGPRPPVTPHRSPVAGLLIYSSADQVFHQPQLSMLADYVKARLALFPFTCSLAPASSLVTRHLSLVTVFFLSPTHLRADGQLVREPEFYQLFKRLRDRLNALSTFYGPGPIDADFKALGELAEEVRTVKHDVHWIERYRTSSKTHQRHELSGFIGSCIYDFAGVGSPLPSGGGLHGTQSPILHQDALGILLPWLLVGEICHMGKHTAWGNGWSTFIGRSRLTWSY
ncbi:MAG TPA: CRISPR system precrRNA processing endoribonuclease RAMP protein Cas6 [Terriglobia bacterium]|nr:CRISPR system precrRNA processing endoribonuclease RAMP protein Cas6 [Terriglobia bacterium]